MPDYTICPIKTHI